VTDNLWLNLSTGFIGSGREVSHLRAVEKRHRPPLYLKHDVATMVKEAALQHCNSLLCIGEVDT